MVNKRQWGLVDANTEQRFLTACREISSNSDRFKNFRQDKEFGVILEAGSREILNLNLQRLEARGATSWFRENLSLFAENDAVGSPQLHEVFDSELISSSIPLYAAHLHEISSMQNNATLDVVIEVGGGYGGLARMIAAFLKPKLYILIDQPEVLEVAKQYLSNYTLETEFEFVSCFDTVKLQKIKSPDLFVSTAALAELSIDIQLFYNSKFIISSKYFYVLYNTLHLREGRQNFKRLFGTWKKFRVHSYLTKENSASLAGESCQDEMARVKLVQWVPTILPLSIFLLLLRLIFAR